METVFQLGPRDWPKVRFVRSPLFETMQAVRVLGDRRREQVHRRWVNTVDAPAAMAALPGLLAVNPARGWVPDFLAPPPQPGERSIADELSLVGSYPSAQVAIDLRRSLESSPTARRTVVLAPMIADPSAALTQLVTELEVAWTTLVAPFWQPVSRLIDRDIAYRSELVAEYGMGRALVDLHPDVSYCEDRLAVRHGDPVTVDLAGRGLQLLPSAFCWPNAIAVHELPWPPTVVYPARGIGTLWTAPAPASAALAGVLGRTRALLLSDLDQAASTSGLAQRHGLSPAATSVHLSRLRAAGQLSARRSGREVLYRRTSIGTALVRSSATGEHGEG
jgi:DNA-binding transcriptional ArsR family regulator